MTKIEIGDLTKLYYSIGEVADMFEVNTSLIRFWEKEFPTIKPKKNKKGNRLFTVKDITTIDRIYTLVKKKGYTLEGAKKALRSKETVTEEPSSGGNQDEIIHKLEQIRQKLLSLKSNR